MSLRLNNRLEYHFPDAPGGVVYFWGSFQSLIIAFNLSNVSLLDARAHEKKDFAIQGFTQILGIELGTWCPLKTC